MGITQFSIEKLLIPYIKEGDSIMELGSQNLYGKYKYGYYANEWYNDICICPDYSCIDLNGENNAYPFDLSNKLSITRQFDIITDFGTSEHVGKNGLFNWDSIYNCWWNKHNFCKIGGFIISENPKTGNWPGHGFNYYTQEFYLSLALEIGYEIKELGEHPAMGNIDNGWNIYCVLKKTNNKFISKAKFQNLNLCMK